MTHLTKMKREAIAKAAFFPFDIFVKFLQNAALITRINDGLLRADTQIYLHSWHITSINRHAVLGALTNVCRPPAGKKTRCTVNSVRLCRLLRVRC